MNTKIYISGKITGLDLGVARNYFDIIEEKLKQAGLDPLNPMALVPYNESWTWADYMAEDVRLLLACDSIFMLENWQDSKGAKIEHAIAQTHGMIIYYSGNHNLF